MNDDLQFRVRALPCWREPVEIQPLDSGRGATAFRVRDGASLFVARIGGGEPIHHVSRRREAAAHRAAHAAGLAPRVVYAGEDALVCDFIEGRILTGADLRRRIETLAMILRRCHLYAGSRLRGEAAAFWVFHVLRDYAHHLEAAGRASARRGHRLLAIADQLEEAQAPMRTVFGHNDLRPANFIDDGERLWLIDWRHAGFGSALFDLASLSVSAEFGDGDDKCLNDIYFGGSASTDILRSFAAMKVAASLREAMGAMVSGLYDHAREPDHGARAAQGMRKFEALYAAYRDRF